MPKRYVDMTSEERLAKANDLREAMEVHVQGFVRRPDCGSHHDRKAWSHFDSCERELAFLERVARSRGDQWAARRA